MALKCYTKQNKSGGSYTTCNKDAQEKNVSNDKMSKEKTVRRSKADDPVQGPWDADQRRLTPEIRKLLPDDLENTIFGNTTASGKGQRKHVVRVKQLPALQKYAAEKGSAQLKSLVKELMKSYDDYRERRSGTKVKAGQPKKEPSKKEDEVRPASKPAPKKDDKKAKARADLVKGSNSKLVNYRVPKVKITPKNFTSVNKLGMSLPQNKTGFTKVKSVKKSKTIQNKPKSVTKVSAAKSANPYALFYDNTNQKQPGLNLSPWAEIGRNETVNRGPGQKPFLPGANPFLPGGSNYRFKK